MISRRGFGLPETVGSFQSLITRITHGDEPWGSPFHHTMIRPKSDSSVTSRRMVSANLIKLDERFRGLPRSLRLLRREKAVPILLGGPATLTQLFGTRQFTRMFS